MVETLYVVQTLVVVAMVIVICVGAAMFLWHIWKWDQGGSPLHLPAALAWIVVAFYIAVKISYSIPVSWG